MSFSQEKSGNQEKLRVFHFFTYRSIGNGKIQFLNKVCSKILLYADLHGHRPGFLRVVQFLPTLRNKVNKSIGVV